MEISRDGERYIYNDRLIDRTIERNRDKRKQTEKVRIFKITKQSLYLNFLRKKEVCKNESFWNIFADEKIRERFERSRIDGRLIYIHPERLFTFVEIFKGNFFF